MRIKLILVIVISVVLSFSSLNLIKVYAENADISVYEGDQTDSHVENFAMMRNQTDNQTNDNKLKFRYVDIDDDKDDKDLPPVADFTYSPSSPTVGEKVLLDGSKSYDKDGEVVSYRWSYTSSSEHGVYHLPVFIGSGKTVRYSWNRPGDYIVFLSVKDDDGLSDVAKKEIHVEKVTQSPTADFSFSPDNPKVGDTVSFDGSKSTDDGSIVSYEWDFGDGSKASGKTATHVYNKEGDYTVTLKVTDDDGLSDVAKKEIHVMIYDDENQSDNSSNSEENSEDSNHNSNHHVSYHRVVNLDAHASTNMITSSNNSSNMENSTTYYSYIHPIPRDPSNNNENYNSDDSNDIDSMYLKDEHGKIGDLYIYIAILIISMMAIIFVLKDKIGKDKKGSKKVENREGPAPDIYLKKVSPKEEIVYIPKDAKRVTKILLTES